MTNNSNTPNIALVDIEDLNNRFDREIARQFPAPTEEDAVRFLPHIRKLLEGPDISHPSAKPRMDPEMQVLCKQHKNSFFMQAYYLLVSLGYLPQSTDDEQRMQTVFRIKKHKSSSGVLVITIFTSAYPEYKDANGVHHKQEFSCTFNCAYCPNEPNQPRSYLKGEPGVLRANRHGFDACEQMWARMETLFYIGHPVDKLEVIVLGGTWVSYPLEYRYEFIRDMYYAANVFWDRVGGVQKDPLRPRGTLEEEKALNMDSRCRVIGLTLETRPDTIDTEELRRFRTYGCTRVQLGIQHTDDAVLRGIRRKCTTAHTNSAIALLKDSGFKVDGHWMPNLPFATPEIDRRMLIDELLGLNRTIQRTRCKNEVWEHYDVTCPNLQLDQWKVYPCAIVPWTEIEAWYRAGTYVPYPEEQLRDILLDMKALVFPWIRLNRIIRDIPTSYIMTNGDCPNMRQELGQQLEMEGKRCQCIRCREVKTRTWDKDYITVIRTYTSSGGTEYFISAENKCLRTLYGFARLRIPASFRKSSPHPVFPELTGAALLREVHVYGQLSQVNNARGHIQRHIQHNGLGKHLISRAEQIAKTHGFRKLAVIAGEGKKRYYEKNGFQLSDGIGSYMLKQL